jgi:hypothetical protein
MTDKVDAPLPSVASAPRDDAVTKLYEEAISALGYEREGKSRVIRGGVCRDMAEAEAYTNAALRNLLTASLAKPAAGGTEPLIVISEDMVEAAARAMYEMPSANFTQSWQDSSEATREAYRREARVALEAAITTSRGSTK